MNKTILASFAVILLVVVMIMSMGKNNPVEESKLPQMKPVENLTMTGDSSSSSSAMINGKETTSSISKKFFEKMKKCQKFQQSALDGYAFYQIWGWQDGKCVYKELINTGLMGSQKTSWITIRECSLDAKQLEEFVVAMQNPNDKEEMRSMKTGNSSYMYYSSYYDFLLKKYEIEGVCKNPLDDMFE